MSDLLTMKQAIQILGVTHLEFYRLRDTGQISDGVSKGQGKKTYYSKKSILKCEAKIKNKVPSNKNNFDLVLSTLQRTTQQPINKKENQ